MRETENVLKLFPDNLLFAVNSLHSLSVSSNVVKK